MIDQAAAVLTALQYYGLMVLCVYWGFHGAWGLALLALLILEIMNLHKTLRGGAA